MATNEKNWKNDLAVFDKGHTEYRVLKFIKFMELREIEFINSFRFEGDDNFNRASQRTFLKLLFKYGYAGIVNTAKAIKSELELSKEDMDLISSIGVKLEEKIESKFGNKIPVSVAPSHWDYSERVVKGKGITSGLNNISRKIFDVDVNNSAIAIFNNSHKSGYSWWLAEAYMSATSDTVLKKRMSLLDSKLVNNKVNNTHRGISYDSVYDVTQSFLELAPSQKSMTGGKEEEISIQDMLDTKLKKLDISNGESVGDLLEFVSNYETMVLTRHGERTNVNEGKQERSISEDFKSMEVHWRRLENETKDQLQMFVDDYNRVFGTKITFVSLVDEVIKEMDEKEILKSGRGQNDDKDKTK